MNTKAFKLDEIIRKNKIETIFNYINLLYNNMLRNRISIYQKIFIISWESFKRSKAFIHCHIFS